MKLVIYGLATFLASFAIGIGTYTQIASAYGVNLSVVVHETSILVEGKTAPVSFVSVRDNGSTVGTTTSDSLGKFSILISGVAVQQHNLEISAVDSSGNPTATTKLTFATYAQYQTIITAFLSPTLILQQPTLLKGSTFPNSTVYLQLTPSISTQLQSDSDGLFSYDLANAGLTTGTYSAYSFAMTTDGERSTASDALTFSYAQSTSKAQPLIAQDPMPVIKLSLIGSLLSPQCPSSFQACFGAPQLDPLMPIMQQPNIDFGPPPSSRSETSGMYTALIISGMLIISGGLGHYFSRREKRSR